MKSLALKRRFPLLTSFAAAAPLAGTTACAQDKAGTPAAAFSARV